MAGGQKEEERKTNVHANRWFPFLQSLNDISAVVAAAAFQDVVRSHLDLTILSVVGWMQLVFLSSSLLTLLSSLSRQMLAEKRPKLARTVRMAVPLGQEMDRLVPSHAYSVRRCGAERNKTVLEVGPIKGPRLESVAIYYVSRGVKRRVKMTRNNINRRG